MEADVTTRLGELAIEAAVELRLALRGASQAAHHLVTVENTYRELAPSERASFPAEEIDRTGQEIAMESLDPETLPVVALFAKEMEALFAERFTPELLKDRAFNLLLLLGRVDQKLRIGMADDVKQFGTLIEALSERLGDLLLTVSGKAVPTNQSTIEMEAKLYNAFDTLRQVTDKAFTEYCTLIAAEVSSSPPN